MDEQPTNQQQLCDAFMSMWTEISAERFHHLTESMPRRTKARKGPSWCYQGVPYKVASECKCI